MNRLLGKRYFERQKNISLIFLLKLLMCAKVNQAHQELWPLFDGGTYARCQVQWINSNYPQDSIYLFNDAGHPSKVASFSQLMPASNEDILSTKALAARVFHLKADTEKSSSGMKQLLKEWKAWLANQDGHEPFLQLKLKEDD